MEPEGGDYGGRGRGSLNNRWPVGNTFMQYNDGLAYLCLNLQIIDKLGVEFPLVIYSDWWVTFTLKLRV
jgi:hypothetical protein